MLTAADHMTMLIALNANVFWRKVSALLLRLETNISQLPVQPWYIEEQCTTAGQQCMG